MQYAVVIEESETGYGASVSDLPRCVAVAESEDEVRQLVREAVMTTRSHVITTTALSGNPVPLLCGRPAVSP